MGWWHEKGQREKEPRRKKAVNDEIKPKIHLENLPRQVKDILKQQVSLWKKVYFWG